MKENIIKVLAILLVILTIFCWVFVYTEQYNTLNSLTERTAQPVIEKDTEEPIGEQILTKDNGMCRIAFTTDENYYEVFSALRELAIMHDLEEFKDPQADKCIIDELKANYNKTVTSLHVTWVCGTFSEWRKI